MKTALVLLLAAALVQLSKQQKCHLKELDDCLIIAVNVVRDNPIPQNEEKVEEQCKAGKEAYDCIRNYTNNCLSTLQRELVSFATEGAHASFNDYCSPGSDLRKSILERSECLSKAWEEQRSCMSDAQAGIESIATAPFESQLDVLCCAYNRYRKCGTEIARKACGDDAEEWIYKVSSLVVSNLPSILCNSCDDDTAKCNNLLPAPGTKPQGSASESSIGRLLGIYLNN